MSKQKYYLPWNGDSIIWGSNDYIWNEVFILIEVSTALGGGGGIILPTKNPWEEVIKKLREIDYPKEKAKIFLQVITRVNGIVKSETKTVDDIEKKITVDHIRKTFEAYGQKVQVTVKNVKKR